MSTIIQSEYSIQINALYEQETIQKAVPHPEWDPKKVYNYLEDMSEGFQSYKRQAVKFYQSDFAIKGQDKKISVEDLKSMIKEYFPQYKLTDREPKEPVTGTYYLYIDQTNMNKLASDPNYRAKVFGLMDSELHRQYTGVGNELILDNIRLLCELDADFFIRIPLIEGVNTDETNIRQTIEFLSSLNWKRRTVNLLPYHDVGKDKHVRMGSKYNPKGHPLGAPSEETQQRCATAFTSAGFTAIIGG